MKPTLRTFLIVLRNVLVVLVILYVVDFGKVLQLTFGFLQLLLLAIFISAVYMAAKIVFNITLAPQIRLRKLRAIRRNRRFRAIDAERRAEIK